MNMYDYNALCEIANSINDEYTKNTFLETIRRYNDCLEELKRKDNIIKDIKEFIEFHYTDNIEFYKNKGIGLDYPQVDYILNKIEELEDNK